MKRKRRLRSRSAFEMAALAMGWCFIAGGGCTDAPDAEARLGIEISKQALTSAQERVFGFETPTADWSTNNGGASLSTSHLASRGGAAQRAAEAWTEDWARYFAALPAFFRQLPETLSAAEEAVRAGHPATASLRSLA
jgi:hypothetical protein